MNTLNHKDCDSPLP